MVNFWVSKNRMFDLRRHGLLALVLIYSVIAFWGKVLRGVSDKIDIAIYLRIGLDFWDAGFAAFSDRYANNGFSILAGLASKITDIHEPYIVILLVSLPCFIGTIYFLFRIFERYLGEQWAIFACLLLSACHSFAGAMARPLSEVPFFFVVSVSLFLTIQKKNNPLFIGLMLGASFWLRNQIIIFLPFWPLLFNNTKGIKSYIKNGVLLGCGFFPCVGCYFWAQGGLDLFYTNHSRATLPSLNIFWNQLKALNVQNSLTIYILGVLSILSPSVRSKEKRLYFFVVISFILQIILLFQKGWVTRPGTYLLFFTLFLYFIVVAMKFDIWPRLKMYRKDTVVWGASIVFVFFLISNASFVRIWKSLTIDNYVQNALCPFRLDRHYLFKNFVPGAVIATDTIRGLIWTKLSVQGLGFQVQQVSPTVAKRFSTNDPFSSSLEVVNSRKTPLSADYLAIWRRVSHNKNIDFPSQFNDKFENRYKLISVDEAPRMVLAIYKISNL